jgi:hypothetical protein
VSRPTGQPLSAANILRTFPDKTTCPVPLLPPRPVIRERAGVRVCPPILRVSRVSRPNVSRPDLGPRSLVQSPKSGLRASDILDLGPWTPRCPVPRSAVGHEFRGSPRQKKIVAQPPVKVLSPLSAKVSGPDLDRWQSAHRGCRESFDPLVKTDPHHRRGSNFRPRRGSDPRRADF